MITNDLVEFMKNVEKTGDEYIYSDDKGNRIPLSKDILRPSVIYQKCKDDEFKQLIFKGMVKDGDIFNEIDDVTQVTKDTITGKKKDATTLVDKPIKVKEMWLVSNAMKISKVYNNKEEALEEYDKINKQLG